VRDGLYSREIDTLANIDRFGVEAILGHKTLYYGEILRMSIAERVKIAYKSREQATDWVSWARENPTLFNLLSETEILCH
jgi:hypothetical protein